MGNRIHTGVNMRYYKKICIAYVLFMVLSLALFLIVFRKVSLANLQVNQYSDQELELYKNIWNGINESVQYQNKQIMKYVLKTYQNHY